MNKKNTILVSIITLLATPQLAYGALDGVKGLLRAFGGILGLLVPVLFSLSLVYFFWGVAQFILKDAGNDKTREDGKKKMIWGIIALFVFVSIYGILSAFGSAIGIRVPVSGLSPTGGESNSSRSLGPTGGSSNTNNSGYLTPSQGGWTSPTF